MSKLLVFGHQNPDTDAITSAISYAYLLKQLGEEAEAVALGEPNEETQYALNYFKKGGAYYYGFYQATYKRLADRQYLCTCITWIYHGLRYSKAD